MTHIFSKLLGGVVDWNVNKLNPVVPFNRLLLTNVSGG
jgi:hypothetical protein